jgi:NTE family protein
MERPKVGLVLSGGGAKGFSHIGVIKELEKHNIPIDVITGASAGAYVGGIYASGTPIDKIEKITLEISERRSFLNLIFDPTLDGGIVKGDKIANSIQKLLTKKMIEEFPIKFGCTAVDIVDEKVYNFMDGDANIAIRASCAVPGLFKPIDYKNMLLVDGGVVDSIPVKLAKDMGAEKIIISNVSQTMPQKKEKMSPLRVLAVSMFIALHEIENRILEENPEAIQIKPPIDGGVQLLSFGNTELEHHLIKIGEEATREKIPEIKEKLGI